MLRLGFVRAPREPGGRERLAVYILRPDKVCWREWCEVGTVMAE